MKLNVVFFFDEIKVWKIYHIFKNICGSGPVRVRVRVEVSGSGSGPGIAVPVRFGSGRKKKSRSGFGCKNLYPCRTLILMHQNICCYIFCSLFNTWKIELLSNKNKNIWVFYWFSCDIDSEKIIVSDFDSDSNPETFCATPISTPQFTRINIWWTNEWMYERKYPFSLYQHIYIYIYRSCL